MTNRSFVVGRSPYADVILAGTGVASRHAEIVATADGRYHLTDCASGSGTWRRVRSDGPWEPVRQAFVAPDEPLRLGDHHCTIQSLLGDQLAPADGVGRAAGSGKGRWRQDGAGEAAEPPRGRVERDPETGEIVPKRL